ncbi:glycosyltransferase family 2 protein [Acidiphilium acidophilum]|uniref:glycosyltransferase family 2 protein n=1 Tax=Acidiphilium acidophilum TaxID=76588 RepID=UPI002E8E67C5|nr:glycosyltransferase family 2 protein [Acidiphilium acidophilum]
MNKFSFSIVACARWEDEFIVEWINYHQFIGFDHIYLYCNDDDPSGLYEKVLPFIHPSNNFVTFHHFMFQGQQLEMYKHFINNHVEETKWIIFLDIDEFLRLPKFEKIFDFVNRFSDDVDSIYIHWLLFGDNGYDVPPSGGVLRNFTRTEGRISNMMTKTLSRARIFKDYSVTTRYPNHIWHYLNSLRGYEFINVVDVLGSSMRYYYFSDDDAVAKNYLSNYDYNKKLVQTCCINHYIRRSKRNLRDRQLRGTLGDFKNQTTTTYNLGEEMWNSHEDSFLAELWAEYIKQSYNTSIVPM